MEAAVRLGRRGVAAVALPCWRGQRPRIRARSAWLAVPSGPAVMWACDRGFVNPVVAQVPALADFLSLNEARFCCDELPVEGQLDKLT